MQGMLAFRDVLPKPEPEEAAPAADPIRDRLQACSRLLALAADELAALERGDLKAKRELARAREELAREIDPATAVSGEEDDGTAGTAAQGLLLPLPQQVARLLAEVLYRLEEREEEERRMQDRWSSLEEDALKAMHTGSRIAPVRAGRYRREPEADARLDLRF